MGAVVDVDAARDPGVAVARVVALQAVDGEGQDDEGEGESGHGKKFAPRYFLPTVADLTLCDNILPSRLRAC